MYKRQALEHSDTIVNEVLATKFDVVIGEELPVDVADGCTAEVQLS